MATPKATRQRIRLVHWNEAAGHERAALLVKAGYRVETGPMTGTMELKELTASPPNAIVIDLSRLPSHGREVALALRSRKSTRGIPLVFAEGEPEKVARIRALLPDATFAAWNGIGPVLKKAIAHPPIDPVRPDSVLAGYSGTPLPKKLGIKEGAAIALVGAPDGFEQTLGALPPGAKVTRSPRGTKVKADLMIWFARSLAEVEKEIVGKASAPWTGGLWIAWPKKASGVVTDLREPDVRRLGLANGLVDYKVCAIDATWSGLKFARRATAKG